MLKRSLAMLLMASGLSVPAQAQSTLCVPGPGFVPGQIQPPPDVSVFDSPHDVAWTGSRRQSFGMGSEEDVGFRAVVDQNKTTLYLSWLIDADFGQQAFKLATDGISFGFAANDGSNSGVLINIILPNSTATASTALPPKAYYFIGSGPNATTQWTAFAGTTAGTWLQSPTTNSYISIQAIPTSGSSANAWFVQAKVPLVAWDGTTPIDYTKQPALGVPYNNNSGNANFGSYDFFWYAAMHLPSDTSPNAVTYYGNPKFTPQGTSLSQLHYPLPSNWPTYSVNTGTSSCAPGWTVSNTNIGRLNTTPQNPLSAMDPFNVNTLVAYPHNEDTANANSAQMFATFKLADWGSQYNDASWTTVATVNVGNTNPPTPASISAQPTVAGSTPPDNSYGIVQATYQPDPATVCQYESAHYPMTIATFNTQSAAQQATIQQDIRYKKCGLLDQAPLPTKPGHQCMQVQLVPASNTLLNTTSVTRNMDFVPNSTFTRDAKIDIAGLAPLPGSKNRDVYLYVQTRNMPAIATEGAPTAPAPLPNPPAVNGTGGDGGGGGTGGGGGCGVDCIESRVNPSVGLRVAAKAAAATTGLVNPDPNPQPAYIVHVFHDTGNVIVTDSGRKLRVVEAQSSFGYYPVHTGPLFGWTHKLTGARRIARDLYRISIPNGGSAMVNTTITAHETACDGGDGGGDGGDDSKKQR